MNTLYHFENVSALEQTGVGPEDRAIAGAARDRIYMDDSASVGEEKILQDPQEVRLVVGIDYGTTFSGIAWATPSGAKCSLDDIDVIERWGLQMDNEEKVPSVISYSRQSQAGEQQWGKSLSADAVTMVHTKLELGLEDLMGELDMTLQVLDGMKNLNFDKMMLSKGENDLPPYSHKSPEEIVTDYLKKMFAYVKMEVRVDENDVFAKHVPTDIVVTIPTKWSYMAMNSTYRALTKAGFNKDNFPKLQPIMFITEPEAAALYTARYYRDEKEEDFLQERDYFILCDAGGGTVDIVSYRVTKRRPALELEQIGKPTGSRCGSIFINHEFKKWLRAQIGDDEYRKLDPNLDIDKNANHASETPAMRELMQAFDDVKKQFTFATPDVRFSLQGELENLDIPGKVNKGLIIIPRAIMRYFFDVCIKQIVTLIWEHVDIIEKRGSRPKHLFLVGGFGASGYLQHRLAETIKEEEMQMSYRQPQESWTAVVRGAVVCGIEKGALPNLRKTDACRHNFAICLDELYSKTRHAARDITQIHGATYAQSQLTWLLNKGDLILCDQVRRIEHPFQLRLKDLSAGKMQLPIYRNSAEEEKRPRRYNNSIEELDIACVLDIRFDKIEFETEGWPLKPALHVATLKLVLELDRNILEASIWWKHHLLSTGPVVYPELDV
ncbi:hypothetical protein BDW02DRAFT_200221 [Decorospora gaudefroyi]|uniref:Actin-like ATPase domain-containing protein n=1 Tax=Decorospora gaudefroyi TaxID=184978 RepID=A0A6A5JYQ7_9PLEO|nr:hypothetical protein BDW02DRAFT_200221 [Decorospora gaudefroyi]